MTFRLDVSEPTTYGHVKSSSNLSWNLWLVCVLVLSAFSIHRYLKLKLQGSSWGTTYLVFISYISVCKFLNDFKVEGFRQCLKCKFFLSTFLSWISNCSMLRLLSRGIHRRLTFNNCLPLRPSTSLIRSSNLLLCTQDSFFSAVQRSNQFHRFAVR